MKIVQIDTMRVFVPWQDSFKEPMAQWRASAGTTPEDEDAYVIVQVHTDEGIVGIGEGGRSVEEIEKQAQSFVGKNPLEMDLFTLRRPWVHAMLDLAGKALGVPAHRLIGTGKYRDRVPVCYWSPYLPPDETARHAEEGALRGFILHKIKARPQDVVEQVEAITDVGGGKIIEFVLIRTSFLICRRQRCRLMMRYGRLRMWNVLKTRCPRRGRNGTGCCAENAGFRLRCTAAIRS